MLSRLSSETLLRTVLAALALLAISALSVSAWNAWVAREDAGRILSVVDASGPVFTTLLNQRTDRSTTLRTWNAAEPITPGNRAYLAALRDAEMPALRQTIVQLDGVAFAGRGQLLPALVQSEATLLRLQKEYWDGVTRPRAERRPGLGEDYNEAGLAMQRTLEEISANLVAGIKLADPQVDLLLSVKQLAWAVRNLGGEGSLLISQGLAAGKLPPEARLRYANFSGGAQASWAAIEDALRGTSFSPRFTAAIATAKQQFFAADYAATRERLLTALIDGTRPAMTADEWSPYTVPKLGSMQDVAQGALAEARDHAFGTRQAATRQLATSLCFLLVAVLVSVFGVMAVTRHIIRPLRLLRDAMARLAGGDLTAEAAVGQRTDEIGALAAAFALFRQNAVDKTAMEAERQTGQAQLAARQQDMERRIAAFEQQVSAALGALGQSSQAMTTASSAMAGIASDSTAQVRAAAAAADDASNNVAGIAAATEELSASIAEITRQVSNSAIITERAVEETRQTDDTVRGLAESAARIGEVVKLISDIAGQTNLLALNATIEAARAGDAGKGFAVVASEVKSLANQTAKATEEIASQISAVRNVTEAAVTAIKRIGATIDEVSTVATAIAAGVEQQGASTQEIDRNTQEAARRTRDVTQTIATVAEGTAASRSNTEAVHEAAASVDTEASRLRGQVTAFLEGIRAA